MGDSIRQRNRREQARDELDAVTSPRPNSPPRPVDLRFDCPVSKYFEHRFVARVSGRIACEFCGKVEAVWRIEREIATLEDAARELARRYAAFYDHARALADVIDQQDADLWSEAERAALGARMTKICDLTAEWPDERERVLLAPPPPDAGSE